ncbi:MAG: helix-turn-helix domain-containing protein [Bifidobacteriaceae bacterium]|jgi:transcriptional regulator with XRE-family HTH domain|nr:helix-turn-helix domain-containing protein [Bifidobacteriaceae bacterium]
MDIRKDAERWTVLLGLEIKGALSAHGVLQSDLVSELGISDVTLSRWLNGHRPMQAWAVIAIAWKIDEPISELFARADRRLAVEHAASRHQGSP